MRSWISCALGVLLAIVTWGIGGCTLVPNPALAGGDVGLSGDGNILAVGAYGEASNATGIDPGPAAQANDAAPSAGAVYLY